MGAEETGRFVGVDEDRRRFWNSADTSMGEAMKALLLLNAGAVIAMLGFVQALLEKSGWNAFKPFVLSAGLLFLIGAASVVPAFTHRAGFATAVLRGDGTAATALYNTSGTYVVVSTVGFLLGAAVIGVGIALKL